MSNNETIDNFLFDEENELTQAHDLWDEFFAERGAQIDDRPWVQADGSVRRNELNQQVDDMLEHVLPEQENSLLRLYFGIGMRRHSMDELAALYDGKEKVHCLLESALEKLRYSDDILRIYKYLYK